MSVRVIADISDVKIPVEVTRSGDLIFPDHDIEYDISMEEFGEPETTQLILYKHWKREAPSTLCWYFEIDFKTMILLAADWAEHSMHVYADYIHNKYEKGMHLKSALEVVREYAKSDFDFKFKSIVFQKDTYVHQLVSYQFYAPARDAARAVWCVVNGSLAPGADNARATLEIASDTAAQAVGMYDPGLPQVFNPVTDPIKFEREQDWQIRRFVDVMEALQAGKTWPSLGATK